LALVALVDPLVVVGKEMLVVILFLVLLHLPEVAAEAHLDLLQELVAAQAVEDLTG
jgi:hypothetical protein